MDKKTIRQEMLRKRSMLSAAQQAVLDNGIHTYLQGVLSDKEHIAVFLSFGTEIRMEPIVEWLLAREKKVYSSKIIDSELKFYQLASYHDTMINEYGIPQPLSELAVKKTVLDVILVPLLAFDKSGQRIGYGKAYYDRYLKDYQGLKLGLAYSFQEVAVIEAEGHDVALEGIVTEKGLHYI